MKSFGISKRGLVRKTNEDNFCILEPNCFVVADGMGGHIAGDLASNIAVNAVREYIENYHSTWINEAILKEAVYTANKNIRQAILEKDDLEGMGTTLIAAYIDDSILFWAHVGDSRLYRYYRGTLTQVTTDHSLVTELLADGKIDKTDVHNHPSKNIITRSVGVSDQVDVDTGRFKLIPETMLLLCTDGLTNMVSDELIRNTMISNETNPKSCAEQLVSLAYDSGATDNVTVVVILIQREEKVAL